VRTYDGQARSSRRQPAGLLQVRQHRDGPEAAVCKTCRLSLRWFEPNTCHYQPKWPVTGEFSRLAGHRVVSSCVARTPAASARRWATTPPRRSDGRFAARTCIASARAATMIPARLAVAGRRQLAIERAVNARLSAPEPRPVTSPPAASRAPHAILAVVTTTRQRHPALTRGVFLQLIPGSPWCVARGARRRSKRASDLGR
jgi:hypothetical protein